MKLSAFVVAIALLPVIWASRAARSYPAMTQRRDHAPVDPAYEMFRNFMGQMQNGFGQPPPNYVPGMGPPFPGVPFGPGTFVPYMPPGGTFPPPGGAGAGAGTGAGAGGTGQSYGFSYGSYGNTVFPILNGMGYSGPYYGLTVGDPNPNYGTLGNGGGGGGGGGGTSAGAGAFGFGGGAGGNVPIVNTRVNPGSYQSGDPGASSSTRSQDGSRVTVNVRNSPDGRPVYREETVRGPGNSYGTAFAYST